MSLRLVRSPPAPKITIAHGPAGEPSFSWFTSVAVPANDSMRPIPPCKTNARETNALCKRPLDGSAETREAGGDVRAQMQAKGAAFAFGEDLKIAAGLRRLDHAKGVLLAGHGQVSRIVARNLQKHAGIRATLVRLAGGMQESRSEAEARGDALAVAHGVPDGLQDILVGLVPFDVGKQGKIIAGAQAIQMRAQKTRKGWICAGGLR